MIQRFANPIGYCLLDTLQHVIRWPDSESFNKLLKGLHRQNLDNEFLMLLEPVDGTHIPIQRPRTQFHQRYINRKGYHSIISDRILLLSGITSTIIIIDF